MNTYINQNSVTVLTYADLDAVEGGFVFLAPAVPAAVFLAGVIIGGAIYVAEELLS